MMKAKIYTPFFIWTISTLFILWPFLYVVIQVNDDAYVYFNYAKNFARGDFFAYDVRGLPSEGFTSLIYLLLLVPFEFFGVSMPFAACFINILALLIASWVVSEIYKEVFPAKKELGWLAGCFFLFLFYLDRELIQLVGRGFESIVNVLFYLILLNAFLVFYKVSNSRQMFKILLLFVASILIRPENALILSPLIIISVWKTKKEKGFWPRLLLFFSFLFLGAIGKWQVFGDVFPTGFYRKINSGSEGISYLMSYLETYWSILLIGLVSLFVAILLGLRGLKDPVLIRVLLPVLICSALTMLFICRVNPLVGYHFRYLIIITATLYLWLSLAGSIIVSRINWAGEVLSLLFLGILFYGHSQKYRSDPRHLYQESINQNDTYPYIRFAKFFQKEVKSPREVTMLFGDAGAIPYYFDCRFIDINGLTEPFLAKLFREKKDRAVKVSDYTKNQKVDLAVLAVENSSMSPRKVDSQYLPHGPLADPKEYRIWLNEQKKEGFVYGGTVFGIDYDLHFGLRTHSTHFRELKGVLEKYIVQGNGRFLPHDLVIEFTDGNVTFQNIHKH